MSTTHVVTVAANLPHHVFDALMTATEKALVDVGATRIWIDPTLPAFAVMADLPVCAIDADGGPLPPAS